VNKVSPVFASLAPAPAKKLSAVATRALKDQASSSGLTAYNTIVGNTTATATDTGAATEDKSATTETTAIKVDAKLFDQINKMSVAAEAFEQDITPALRIENNEITLAGSDSVAILAVMSFDELGSVMVTGNRVVVPDASTVACSLLGPVAAVVTGNMFWQKALPPDGAAGQFSLIVLAGSTGIVAAGNVTVFAEYIAPARPAQASTATWDFLNTVAV
jgi:hypothetical protein